MSNNLNSSTVKEIIHGLGADLCGIAGVASFDDAPEGHRPRDIYSECLSIVVFALRWPRGAVLSGHCIPYTFAKSIINQKCDFLTIDVANALETEGANCVPLPPDSPYDYWDSLLLRGEGTLSMRHAALKAGLGVLGKNSLLINDRFGNMVQIGAVLLDIELTPDQPATYVACPEGCSICLESCPQKALANGTVSQKLCRPISNVTNERGFVINRCNTCRTVCPSRFGIKK